MLPGELRMKRWRVFVKEAQLQGLVGLKGTAALVVYASIYNVALPRALMLYQLHEA